VVRHGIMKNAAAPVNCFNLSPDAVTEGVSQAKQPP
jgi:hypothetical protein